jgi:hypothetical protein
VVIFEEEQSQVEGYYARDLYLTTLLTFVEHIRVVNAQVTIDIYAKVRSCIESDHTRDNALTDTWKS